MQVVKRLGFRGARLSKLPPWTNARATQVLGPCSTSCGLQLELLCWGAFQNSAYLKSVAGSELKWAEGVDDAGLDDLTSE